MKIFLKQLQKPKVYLSLVLFFFLICFLFFEFRQQWEEQEGRFNCEQIIEKINATDAKDLKSVKIIHLGNSFLRQDAEITKIIVELENGKVYYAQADHNFMFLEFWRKINEFGPEKSQKIDSLTNFEYFKIKPFTFLLSPFLRILSSVSAIWWMMYLYRTRSSGHKKSKNFEINYKQQQEVTFDDIAGNEEEKEELKEMVDFLKRPQKYVYMGAKIPKGVLLSGPPGTGKTLLAKALAGEAGTPFYFASGSEFVEMYVGVGASRVRALFQEAKENAPCVIFIDEIDVLGGKRGRNLSGGSQEKDQTLNQLLTEMDGFSKSLGVVIIGATNRVDILDPALLRPGRFDRQILVNLPDTKSREAILKVHARNKFLSQDVNFFQIAKQTQGMSGAQLATVLNEASILAVRAKKNIISMEEMQEAIDRVWFGPAKKSIKFTEEEKKHVSYHEAGHAVICLKLPNAPKLQKITIIPRGMALGYVLLMEEEELFSYTKKRLQADIICSLGGRAAEEMMFGDDNISNGCYQDFKQATRQARMMVTKYGMSELGLMQDDEFSDKKAINEEMKKIIESSYKQAQKILQENQDLMKQIADILIVQETITKEEVENLLIS